MRVADTSGYRNIRASIWADAGAAPARARSTPRHEATSSFDTSRDSREKAPAESRLMLARRPPAFQRARCRRPERRPIRPAVDTEELMPVVATGVRERSFRTVIGGFDPEAVRTALDGAATECERLDAEIALLKEQQAGAVREIDRMSELERSLLRSCVAAEEDARIRCGAARRYAARMIAAAEEQAAARLEAPGHERDRITREIDAIHEKRRHAATAIENVIAELRRPVQPEVREDAAQFETGDAALADRAP